MKPFDVLDPELDLFANHFIEASAGTGKTFTIEHLFVRLLEAGIDLEEILVVTFTRAATKELKERIRGHLGSEAGRFDEARILTIHSFCFRELSEQALEADFPLDQMEEGMPESVLEGVVRDFLREEPLEAIDLEVLLRHHKQSIDRLISSLVRKARKGEKPEPVGEVPPFEVEELMEEARHFKGVCTREGKFKEEGFEVGFHPILLKLQERLKKAPEMPKWLEDLLEVARVRFDPEQIELRLAERLAPVLERAIEERELLFFDDLLKKMGAALEHRAFVERVRAKYKVALIDEFQDTDPLQWKIFSTLFFGRIPLYVVGDPKQAIYRFREADIYTYLEAKEAFGEATWSTLKRNYRSAPPLVEALNQFFGQFPHFFPLPKLDTSLPCPPVEWDPEKEGQEGGLTFFEGEKEADLFAFVVEKIREVGAPFAECAVLVKDRYQGARFEAFARERGLPTLVTRSRSLLESPAYPTLIELLEAVRDPRDLEAVKRVLCGPLFRLGPEAVEGNVKRLDILERASPLTVVRRVVELLPSIEEELYADLIQLAELVVDEVDPLRALRSWDDPDEERFQARQLPSQDAIRILTIHVSKGLEFDVVFPLGLILASPSDPEHDAEKMRQLYVAMTRARCFLYVPLLHKLPPTSPLGLLLDGQDRPQAVPCGSAHGHSAPTRTFVLPVGKSIDYTPLTIESFTSLAQKKPPLPVPETTLPAGPEVGTLLHSIFETIDFQKPLHLAPLLQGTVLEDHLVEVTEMIERALHTPLPCGVPLSAIPSGKILKELPFLTGNYIKGFIDLVFEHDGLFYAIDWKSNVLPAYDPPSIQAAMDHHDYPLQSRIYADALKKYLALFDCHFASSYTIFLRGLPDGIFVC